MRSSFSLCLLLSVALAASASAQSSFFKKKPAAAPAAPPNPTVGSQDANSRGAGQPASANGGNAVFRPGDSLDMRVSGVPTDESGSFPSPVTIGGDGFINITYVGQIRAAGLTQGQLERAIEKRFVDEKIFRWPTVTINVMNQQRAVTVGGAVRGPGRQNWSPDLTLLSALSAAGGGNEYASDKVNLIRNGTNTQYRIKLLKKNPADDPRLLPGDQVDLL